MWFIGLFAPPYLLCPSASCLWIPVGNQSRRVILKDVLTAQMHREVFSWHTAGIYEAQMEARSFCRISCVNWDDKTLSFTVCSNCVASWLFTWMWYELKVNSGCHVYCYSHLAEIIRCRKDRWCSWAIFNRCCFTMTAQTRGGLIMLNACRLNSSLLVSPPLLASRVGGTKRKEEYISPLQQIFNRWTCDMKECKHESVLWGKVLTLAC